LLLDGLIWIKSERKIVAKARISVKEQHKAAKRDPLHFHDKHKKLFFPVISAEIPSRFCLDNYVVKCFCLIL
jgi:hypothetical protein